MDALTFIYGRLADLILLVHFGFVVFVIGGFLVIWIGYFCGWEFVRDRRFRLAHLVAMALVVAECVIGMTCPLTTWENQLRLLAGEGESYSGSFIQHWLGRILFWELSESTFTVIYSAFFGLIVLTLWVIRPARRVR